MASIPEVLDGQSDSSTREEVAQPVTVKDRDIYTCFIEKNQTWTKSKLVNNRLYIIIIEFVHCALCLLLVKFLHLL